MSNQKEKKKQGKQFFFNAKNQKEETLVVTKLESAFIVGATDEQACVHAGISRTSLFRYEEKYPEFRNRKKDLKSTNGLTAKFIVSSVLHEKGKNKKPTKEAKKIAYEIYKHEMGIGKHQVVFKNEVNKTGNPIDNVPISEETKQAVSEIRKRWRKRRLADGSLVDVNSRQI